MVVVKKPLWHLPALWRERLWQEIVNKAKRDELGAALQRVSVVPTELGLELEFWFQDCSIGEAARCVSAALRDAAASIDGTTATDAGETHSLE
jgi:hypothetical protein